MKAFQKPCCGAARKSLILRGNSGQVSPPQKDLFVRREIPYGFAA